MRTEYDAEPDYEPPQRERKSKRQKRVEARRKHLEYKCQFCRHPAGDHGLLTGAERHHTWCHTCLEKCLPRGTRA